LVSIDRRTGEVVEPTHIALDAPDFTTRFADLEAEAAENWPGSGPTQQVPAVVRGRDEARHPAMLRRGAARPGRRSAAARRWAVL
jgi:hypothetical protein